MSVLNFTIFSRPGNEADVFYRLYRNDLYDNIGMVNENGQNWKTLRKHLSPPLTNRRTPLFYAQSMNEVADELVNVMRLKALNNDSIIEGK